MFEAPFLVDFDITLQCNLRCLHCNVAAGEALENELSLNEIKSVIDEMYDIGVMELTITGGEPLLRPDCFDIITYVGKYHGWKVSLNTNGILWTREKISRVAHDCPDLQVVVSVDGNTPNTYGILRKLPNGTSAGDLFKHVLNVIIMLKEHGVNTTVNYDLTDLTIPFFWETAEFFIEKYEIPILGIKFFPYGYGYSNRFDLEISYCRWAKFLVQITELLQRKEHYKKFVTISTTCPWELYMPLLNAKWSTEQIEQIWAFIPNLRWKQYSSRRNVECGAGITECALDASGNMTPCGTISARIPEMIAGNVKIGRFKKVWDESRLLKEIRNVKLSDIGEPCISCFLKNICGGGCRARAYVITGNYSGLDPACPKVAMWLKTNEGGEIYGNYPDPCK